MAFKKIGLSLLAAALLMVVLITAACGDGGDSLTREEVREIARSEAAASAPAPAQPSLTKAEAEEIVRSAIANLPEPQPGLGQADVEQAIQKAMEAQAGSLVTRSEVEQAIQAAMEAQAGSLVTRSEVEDAVRAVANAIPDPGITASEVEELLQTALADIPEASPGLTAEEARSIAAQVAASIPSKSSPARYTQFVVDSAVARYQTEGLDSTVAHYNDFASVDGQWYVFVVGQNGEVVSHFNPEILGENLNGILGTDANGYNFGPEMLSATEEGKWVSYVYNNPATRDDSTNHLGAVELKHAWVVRHDDLIFGSGWYVNADEFTMQLVAQAVETYRQAGLEGTVAQFAGSDSATAGLSETIAFYNAAEDITGDWFALIADSGGTIVAHYDPTLIGSSVPEKYGEEMMGSPTTGSWVTSLRMGPSGDSGTLRAWVVGHDGMIFAAGWQNEEGS